MLLWYMNQITDPKSPSVINEITVNLYWTGLSPITYSSIKRGMALEIGYFGWCQNIQMSDMLHNGFIRETLPCLSPDYHQTMPPQKEALLRKESFEFQHSLFVYLIVYNVSSETILNSH